MNILIADSGSTKTEWILSTKKGNETTIITDGLNPYFKNQEDIQTLIWDEILPKIPASSIDQIYFYGAGCGSEKNREIVKKAINKNYKNAHIHVDTDLLGASIACLGDEAGVACILGTGSNACMYDGNKIIHQIPSLGFSLGDEGSGGYFGKRIIRDFFYDKMPQEIRSKIQSEFEMDLRTVLEKVYQQAVPNRFVASFAQILIDFEEHKYIIKLVEEGFNEFIKYQLFYFADIADRKIGFVGSIAAAHKKTLEKVLTRNGLQKPYSIVQKPIENIVRYHRLKC